MTPRFSLRQWLTIPYVALILGVAALVGALSYRTGSEVVDTLSRNLMLETVARIAQAVDRQLIGSAAVLETAFARGMTAAPRLETDLEALRSRFWAATSLHGDFDANVLYGNRAGQMVSMYREGPDRVEWRLRPSPTGPRETYVLPSIDAPLPKPTLLTPPLDPRQRPWYQRASTSNTLIWTSVYIDAVTRDLVVTRAKRVNDAAGDFQGVVATDVALHSLNSFVRSLSLSPHSVAFVIEAGGELIASSRTPNIRRGADGENTRINAAESGDPLQVAAYRHMRQAIRDNAGSFDNAHSLRFTGPGGQLVQLAFSHLRDDAGLDWFVAVAAPRSDFMQGVMANVLRTAAIGGLAALGAAGLGLLILNWLSSDLQRLTRAARLVGQGQLDEILEVRGRGTIGELASTFSEMQLRLRTDALTGLANRDWLMRCIDRRIGNGQRETDREPFAVLFIDMNRFKLINDTLGHESGDRVLIEVGARLRSATRDGDVVARYAGDEFAVLLGQVRDLAAAEKMRKHVHTCLLPPFESLAQTALREEVFGASVGLAVFPGPAHNAEELVRLADQDMYAVKTRGRD
ncbi:hypothetical protein RD110_21200 [Rhodoferax koreense]|uniref:Sensor domain-containing diguanylate cyclase n=1 Tax=Rhodoferax koreensis TaxID=1842727 RepID=A0A1P8K088_9BURK|nr:diguanylate cyclase [Rhodoferax koreense]APW39420.1 hypothetical protein RD110_21200 [Rhodoferax koreense]